MRLVSVEMLRPEMKIARPVYQQEALILPAGRNNVNRFIPNLKNMGIEYVYVEDDIEQPEKVQEEKDKLAKYEQMMAQVEERLAQM